MDRQSLQPPVSPFFRIFYPFYFNLSQLNAKFTFFYLLILTIDYFQFLNLILFDITYSSNIPTNFPFIQWIKKLYLFYPHRNFSAARIITIILFILFIIQALFISYCDSRNGLYWKYNHSYLLNEFMWIIQMKYY